MILGSGVDLGGPITEQWLQNVTVAAVASGALIGGRLVDQGRETWVVVGSTTALALGLGWSWLAPGSELGAMLGLGCLGSLGSGMLLALAVVVVAHEGGGLRGLFLGMTLGAGQLGAESVWGSASLLSIAQGSAAVLGWATLIAPIAAAAGGGLLLVAVRSGRDLTLLRFGRLPLWGAAAAPGVESRTFVILLALAFMASFAGLMAMHAGAALSLIGLPPDSFASGVLVGRSFALGRGAGALLGGALHDLVGSRIAAISSALALGASLLVACHRA
jgi:hypothetical protein